MPYFNLQVVSDIEKRLNKFGITIQLKENVDRLLVKETRQYYRFVSNKMMNNMSCPAYLKKVTIYVHIYLV